MHANVQAPIRTHTLVQRRTRKHTHTHTHTHRQTHKTYSGSPIQISLRYSAWNIYRVLVIYAPNFAFRDQLNSNEFRSICKTANQDQSTAELPVDIQVNATRQTMFFFSLFLLRLTRLICYRRKRPMPDLINYAYSSGRLAYERAGIVWRKLFTWWATLAVSDYNKLLITEVSLLLHWYNSYAVTIPISPIVTDVHKSERILCLLLGYRMSVFVCVCVCVCVCRWTSIFRVPGLRKVSFTLQVLCVVIIIQ